MLMVLVAGLPLAGPASATNFGSSGLQGTGEINNGVWFTDNASWVVARIALAKIYSDGVYHAVYDEYAPTVLSVSLVTPSTCSDSAHDACVFDADYGDNGLNGWNACGGSVSGAHPSQRCSLSWVRINAHFSPPAKHIACHELGHGLGLRHTTGTTAPAASCMNDTSNYSYLSSHDEFHINAKY